jgi:hypothetical protein
MRSSKTPGKCFLKLKPPKVRTPGLKPARPEIPKKSQKKQAGSMVGTSLFLFLFFLFLKSRECPLHVLPSHLPLYCDYMQNPNPIS